MIPGLSAKEDVHPILRLMAEAKTRLQHYRRRYGRAPPKGFDAWYNHARSVNFVMVDEFDGLNEDLVEAFWGMEGKEMRRRVREVGRVKGVDVVWVEDGEMHVVVKRELREDEEEDDEWLDSEASARAHGFMAMLQGVEGRLPEMDFALNAKAEGRVVVAWEALHSISCWGVGGERDYLAGSSSVPASGGGDAPQDADTARAKRALSPADPASHSSGTRGTQNEEFAFVRTGNVRRAEEDFCKEPATRYVQGHVFSEWRTLPALYPVLFPARAAGFGDVQLRLRPDQHRAACGGEDEGAVAAEARGADVSNGPRCAPPTVSICRMGLVEVQLADVGVDGEDVHHVPFQAAAVIDLWVTVWRKARVILFWACRRRRWS
ncbi:hypothetical protein C8J57DRAFT_1223682 [Mycena rebaudengoi]|nr:hypothetical protein C8J57DRAFT_1223682 [Mycena rebaudengoi]